MSFRGANGDRIVPQAAVSGRTVPAESSPRRLMEIMEADPAMRPRSCIARRIGQCLTACMPNSHGAMTKRDAVVQDLFVTLASHRSAFARSGRLISGQSYPEEGGDYVDWEYAARIADGRRGHDRSVRLGARPFAQDQARRASKRYPSPWDGLEDRAQRRRLRVGAPYDVDGDRHQGYRLARHRRHPAEASGCGCQLQLERHAGYVFRRELRSACAIWRNRTCDANNSQRRRRRPSLGRGAPAPAASATSSISTPSRSASSAASKSCRTALPPSTARTRSPAWSTSTPCRISTVPRSTPKSASRPRGDGEEYQGFANYGISLEHGSIFLSASYVDDQPVLAANRPLTQISLTGRACQPVDADLQPARPLHFFPAFRHRRIRSRRMPA